MTCKIAGCTGDEYRARLCLSCYDYWKIHGALPKRASERRAVEAPPDLEVLLAAEQRKTTQARDNAQHYKEQRDQLQKQIDKIAHLEACVRRADQLADAAADLPDVVKSARLKQALSNYRKARL